MHIPDDDQARFEQLDDQRRRVYDDFNLLVQRIREGSIGDDERAKLDAQHLQVRHQQIIRSMIDLLVW
jgi:hypothetical protein